MKIDNVKVYDLAESIVASGLPMQADYDSQAFEEKADSARVFSTLSFKDFDRAERLAGNPPGTGHNNFLSGILVSYNVTATQAWWMQMERYHFNQIVSSQSKMHRLKTMNLFQACNTSTEPDVIGEVATIQRDVIEHGKNETELIYSCPMGLEFTARCTTNYLQLKTIWNQRHNHKLKEWQDYCEWITTLPLAFKLIVPETKKEEKK